MEDIVIKPVEYTKLSNETIIDLLEKYIKYQTININQIKISRLLKHKLVDNSLLTKDMKKHINNVDISFLDYALNNSYFESDFEPGKIRFTERKTFKVFLLESGVLPIVDALTDVWVLNQWSPRFAYLKLAQAYATYQNNEQSYTAQFEKLFSAKDRKKIALTIIKMSNKDLSSNLENGKTYPEKLKSYADICLEEGASKFALPLVKNLYNKDNEYSFNSIESVN